MAMELALGNSRGRDSSPVGAPFWPPFLPTLSSVDEVSSGSWGQGETLAVKKKEMGEKRAGQAEHASEKCPSQGTIREAS